VDAGRQARLALTFGLDRALPGYRPERLDLAARDDDVVAGLAEVGRRVAEAVGRGDGPLGRRARGLVEETAAELAALLTRAAGRSAAPGDGALLAAPRFAELYAAACCVHLWWYNRDASLWGQPPASLRWLVPALALLVHGGRASAEDLDPAADLVTELTSEALLFSAVPLPLAEGQAQTTSGMTTREEHDERTA
jgi:hypothetical protein